MFSQINVNPIHFVTLQNPPAVLRYKILNYIRLYEIKELQKIPRTNVLKVRMYPNEGVWGNWGIGYGEFD